MINYLPANDQVISHGLGADLTINLEKNEDTWCISVIERGQLQEGTELYFKDEYLACLKFLNMAGKLTSELPDEMKVLDFVQHGWFLLDKNGEFYLDVNCALHQHFDYSWNLKLNQTEILNYRRFGRTFLNQLHESISKTNPIREYSDFNIRKLDSNLDSEVHEAILNFNKKRYSYIEKNYKTFETEQSPNNETQKYKSQKIAYWFVSITTTIVAWISIRYFN